MGNAKMTFHEAYIIKHGDRYFAVPVSISGDRLTLTPGPQNVAEYDCMAEALEDIRDFDIGGVLLIGRFENGRLVSERVPTKEERLPS